MFKQTKSKVKPKVCDPTLVLNAIYFIKEILEQLIWLFCPLRLIKVKLKLFGVLLSTDIVVSVKKSKQTFLLKR
jgi:hypothetical protein